MKIHSFNTSLFSTYHAPESVLGTGDTAVNSLKISAFLGHFWGVMDDK